MLVLAVTVWVVVQEINAPVEVVLEVVIEPSVGETSSVTGTVLMIAMSSAAVPG